jgi:hypothetical protein
MLEPKPIMKLKCQTHTNAQEKEQGFVKFRSGFVTSTHCVFVVVVVVVITTSSFDRYEFKKFLPSNGSVPPKNGSVEEAPAPAPVPTPAPAPKV